MLLAKRRGRQWNTSACRRVLNVARRDILHREALYGDLAALRRKASFVSSGRLASPSRSSDRQNEMDTTVLNRSKDNYLVSTFIVPTFVLQLFSLQLSGGRRLLFLLSALLMFVFPRKATSDAKEKTSRSNMYDWCMATGKDSFDSS